MVKTFVVLTVFCILAVGLTGSSAQAQESRPIQLSLVTPIQIFPEDVEIAGVRFNLLYGRQASVMGLDIGLVNHTTTGISKGLQYGFVSINDADYMGWQYNFVSITKGNFEGLQMGFVNSANHCSGLQLGFVNYAGTMHGLQIGLVNIIKSGGQFPVFPIVNWSF